MKVLVELEPGPNSRKSSFENAHRVSVPVPGEDATVIRIEATNGEYSVFVDDAGANETECVWSTLL